MGELYDKYIAQQEIDKENILKENALIEEDTKKYERLDKSIRDIKDIREESAIRFGNFKDTVKNVLLSEALFKIFSPCLGENYSRQSKILAENLIYDFIERNDGADTILTRKRGVSYAIESIYNEVEDYYKLIVEKADKSDPKVDKEDMSEFLDKLDNDADIENVSQAIAIRVANAEEEFINNNMSDKLAIKSIIDDTAARIDAAKNDGSIDMTNAEIEEEANMICKQKIKQNNNRPKSLFEYMVQNLAEQSMKSESMRESYVKNEKIDVDKIVESVRCIYGVLETVNTLRLENVNEEYIQNMF